MIDEIFSKRSWLGDPNVTLVSDDGHKCLCHQSVLGICNENLRSILSHHKLNEHVLIFEQTSYFELNNYVDALYSSFDNFVLTCKEKIENSGQIKLLASSIIESDKDEVIESTNNSSKIENIITEGQTNIEGNDQPLQNDTMVHDDDQLQNGITKDYVFSCCKSSKKGYFSRYE